MDFLDNLLLIGFDITNHTDNSVIGVWFDESCIITVNAEKKDIDYDICITKLFGEDVSEVAIKGDFDTFFDRYLTMKRRKTDNAICTKQGTVLS